MTRFISYITLPVFSCCCAICQSPDNLLTVSEKIYNYKFVIEAPVYACSIIGIVAGDAILQVAEPGAVFTVIGSKGADSVIIRFWIWKENPEKNSELCYADSLCTKRKYFLLALADMKEKTVPRYNRKASFTAGTVLIPVKMRLQKFDFSKDFTIGTTAGVKFRLSNYVRNYINVLAGLGITSVTLDKRSTNGKIKQRTEVPAVSPSLGFVMEFNNTAQAGIFCGCDYISDNENKNLIYHGKLWLSFGLGFTILSQESNISLVEEDANK
jgi:hypothetical protein